MRSRRLLILLPVFLAFSCVRMGPDRQTESLLQGLDMVKKVEPGDFQLWVAGDSASGEALSFKVK